MSSPQFEPKLVWHFVHKYKSIAPWCELDDLFQIASLAYIYARNTFDPSKGMFSTLLGVTIRNQFLMLARSKHEEPVSFEDAINDDLVIGDTISSGEVIDEQISNKLDLKKALRRLSEKERDILILNLVHGVTQREIGAKYGISQVQVSRIINKTKSKLREELTL